MTMKLEPLAWLADEPPRAVRRRILTDLHVLTFWKRLAYCAVPEERDAIYGRRDRAQARYEAVRNAHFDAWRDAMTSIQGEIGYPGGQAGLIDRLVQISDRIAPLTKAARTRAWDEDMRRVREAAERAESPKRATRFKARKTAHHERTVAVRDAAEARGDREAVRICDMILAGQQTETAVREFLRQQESVDL